jgi:hypothetical protein
MGSTRVLHEDIENEKLLYLGTEFSVWASINRGESWSKINNNLPTVAVLDFAQHPTSGELVAATHGRSLWILDVTTLRQMTADAVKAKAFLYKPNDVIRWRSEPAHGPQIGAGSRRFVGENPRFGAEIMYSLTAKAGKARIQVQDYTGRTVRELEASSEPGLHRVEWNLMMEEQPSLLTAVTGGKKKDIPAQAGMYRVVLKVDGDELKQGLKLEADPITPDAVLTEPTNGEDDEDEDQPMENPIGIGD